MKNLDHIEEFRVDKGPLASTKVELAQHGMFTLPVRANTLAICVASNGKHDHADTGWEHVSVHVKYRWGGKKKRKDKVRKPTQDEIIMVRNIFWEPGEAVMQLFSEEGAKGDGYASNVHLWHPTETSIPRPGPEIYTAGLNFIRVTATSSGEENDGSVAE